MIITNIVVYEKPILVLSEYEKLRFAFNGDNGLEYIIELDNKKLKQNLRKLDSKSKQYQKEGNDEKAKKMRTVSRKLISLLRAYERGNRGSYIWSDEI